LLEFGANSALRIDNKKIAVKTGTTNDIRDNWTIGYTPQYAVTVWVGNFDHSPMAGIASGITGAAPIWHIIMDHLTQDQATISWPNQPSDVVRQAICSPSGLLPSSGGGCSIRNEYFLKGTVPKQVDPGMQKTWVDKTTQDLPKSGQTDNLELKDEEIITDPLNNHYCITCQHPTPTPTPTP
jgi:membrane carboxypeptidase/penicillin-binding protein PbpC